MISIEEAQQHVLEGTTRRDFGVSPLSQSLGLILAEDIASDLDMPPYDKALVDGFAVRAADLPEGRGELEIVAEIFAGETPAEKSATVGPGRAVRIMTGAPMPPGADSVVMVERTSQRSGVRRQGSEASQVAGGRYQLSEIRGGPLPAISDQQLQAATQHSPLTTHQVISIDDPRLKPGQNIMRRATELQCGQIVLRAGTQIRPPEMGLLAEVGRGEVPVYPRPRVAIVSTGNEIVEANEAPRPGQIRNSNGPLLTALVARMGGEPRYLGIARDTHEQLVERLRRGLESDVLIVSGGVSAGQLDLVPGVLRELGVREVFHKVHLKPGKPVWFGVADQASCQPAVGTQHSQPTTRHSPLPHSSLVFGLPGNPVSAIACFELFVRPAIRKMMGCRDPGPRLVWAKLAVDKPYRTDRPTYWPASLECGDDGYQVRPVAWHGSPDLRATTEANAFVLLPEGEHNHRAGDRVQVLMTEW